MIGIGAKHVTLSGLLSPACGYPCRTAARADACRRDDSYGRRAVIRAGSAQRAVRRHRHRAGARRAGDPSRGEAKLALRITDEQSDRHVSVGASRPCGTRLAFRPTRIRRQARPWRRDVQRRPSRRSRSDRTPRWREARELPVSALRRGQRETLRTPAFDHHQVAVKCRGAYGLVWKASRSTSAPIRASELSA